MKVFKRNEAEGSTLTMKEGRNDHMEKKKKRVLDWPEGENQRKGLVWRGGGERSHQSPGEGGTKEKIRKKFKRKRNERIKRRTLGRWGENLIGTEKRKFS